jgi:hypothetical protein
VITQAASGDPDVKALVYLAALAPDSGDVLGKLIETAVAHPSPRLRGASGGRFSGNLNSS